MLNDKFIEGKHTITSFVSEKDRQMERLLQNKVTVFELRLASVLVNLPPVYDETVSSIL